MATNDEELNMRVNLDTSDAERGFDRLQNETRETERQTETTTRNARRGFSNFNQQLKNMVMAGGGMWLVQVALKNIVKGVKYALEVANQYDLALQGLTETAKAYGQSQIEAQEMANKLTEDGLLNIEQASLVLKNLMGAGFSISEAFDIAQSMKDIGAFNNVVGDLGQAMVDSSKGIKTGSIELIENIGLTERLSTTMDKAGVSYKKGISLIDNIAQRQAVYNGIIEQGAKFQDNSIELAKSYEGATLKLDKALADLADTFGTMLQPEVQELINGFSNLIVKFDAMLEKSGKVREFIGKELAISLKIVSSIMPEFGKELVSSTIKMAKNGDAVEVLDLKYKTYFQDMIEGYTKEANASERRAKKQEIELENEEQRAERLKKLQSQERENLIGHSRYIREVENGKNVNSLNLKLEELEAEEKRVKMLDDARNRDIESLYNYTELFNSLYDDWQTDVDANRFEEQAKLADHNRKMADLYGSNAEIQRNETQVREDEKKKQLEIEKKYASVSRAITQKVLAGELKGIEDLKEVILKQVQADALGKTIQLTTTGIVETVLSLASAASGNVAGATAHADTATTAFAMVPQVATIAGISTGLLGGVGGGEGVTDVNDGTVSQTQEIEANAQDQTPTLSLNVGDSNVLQALIPELDQALKDKWNVSIISK